MLCELCGQDKPFLRPVIVEGSLLKVCSECAKFGKEPPRPAPTSAVGTSGSSSGHGGVSSYTHGFDEPSKEETIQQRLEFRERRMKSKDIFTQRGEKELVEDYHKRIQQARSELDWDQKQLGQKINERKSVISMIENKSMKPDDKLVRKLEKALNIKLMEVPEE